LLLPSPLLAQQVASNDEQKIKDVIIQLFDGFSQLDHTKITRQTTPDFMLLENGMVWNNDTIVKKITLSKNKYESFSRVNRIEFIRTEIRGKTAWTCFYNEANIRMDSTTRSVRWLESAVLIKKKNEWKVQQFHSTVLR
ncbi:MAG TPA: nuclear transport factor 2 family protein, partial [Ignavibacteriaceae bacterium]